MKVFLIVLNILLACAGGWTLLTGAAAESGEDEYFFKKSGVRTAKAKAKTQETEKTEEETVRNPEEQIRDIAEHNIFDSARCPNAMTGGRANNNVKVEMTLAGTFTIGGQSGAIILQKQQKPQTPPLPPGMQNRNQQNRNGQQNNSANGVIRQRFGPMIAGQNEEPEVVYNHYIRIGETLANGYKLTAVTRTTATLMKGSEKLELTIAESSKNAGGNQSSGSSSNQNMRNMPPWMMMPPPWMRNNNGSSRQMNPGGNWQQNGNMRGNWQQNNSNARGNWQDGQQGGGGFQRYNRNNNR